MELLIARNPDPDSSLPYLLHVPIGSDGLVFRTKDTSALYCHPVAVTEWPDQPEIVERIPLKTCTRRGAAIRPTSRSPMSAQLSSARLRVRA